MPQSSDESTAASTDLSVCVTPTSCRELKPPSHLLSLAASGSEKTAAASGSEKTAPSHQVNIVGGGSATDEYFLMVHKPIDMKHVKHIPDAKAALDATDTTAVPSTYPS